MSTRVVALRLWMAALILMSLLVANDVRAGVLSADHVLSVDLVPAERRLVAEDRITLELEGEGQVILVLNADVRVYSLTWDSRKVDYTMSRNGELRLELPGGARGVLAISYGGTFTDPYQTRPPTMDNPGQGVLGTISEQGAFLLPGSGWYPMINSPRQRFQITIEAPEGMHAVTLGRLEKFAVEGGRSVTQWTVEHPTGGLPLCAGPYALRSVQADGIAIQTFLFPGTRELAPVYLNSSADYVRFYSDLHGPYPFPKFAVVENFFPTGYGFASFTLLGTEVLKLPFIPATSLRHEVAHCWWGNGVLVDFARGNWSEGLATYVADYLSRELKSEEAAREYRTQVLRDFALLAQGQDLPLSRFRSRTDPASRAVGYGKAMFVFHMARRLAGEDRFWEGLRTVYRTKLFQEASWSDFGDAFVRQGGWDRGQSESFWEQFVHRGGGPILSLEGVDVSADGQGWKVRATLRQEGEPYALHLPVVLQTEQGAFERMIRIDASQHSFELISEHRPTRLLIDPDHHVFRVLSPVEIPATVNAIKGSNRLAGVLSEEKQSLEHVLRALLVSLGQSAAPIVRERDLRPEDLQGRDMLVFGKLKDRPDMPPQLGDAAPRGAKGGGRSLFTVVELSGEPSRKAAYFLPADGEDAETLLQVVRKITHYGKYTTLHFDGATVVGKSLAEPSDSPLAVDLAGPDRRRKQ